MSRTCHDVAESVTPEATTVCDDNFVRMSTLELVSADYVTLNADELEVVRCYREPRLTLPGNRHDGFSSQQALRLDEYAGKLPDE
jgi:hypothetical protein